MFNMKKCEKYNLKEAFEEKHDWDFSICYVSTSVCAGRRITVLHPISTFSLFGISVLEARKIAKSIDTLSQYVCIIDKIID